MKPGFFLFITGLCLFASGAPPPPPPPTNTAFFEPVQIDIEFVERPADANKNLILSQPEVKTHMRSHLLDFLVETSVFMPEDEKLDTFTMAVQTLDAYMSRCVVPVKQYQLFGITALFLASKYNNQHGERLRISACILACENTYSAENIKKAERTMLTTLDHDLFVISPSLFLKGGDVKTIDFIITAMYYDFELLEANSTTKALLCARIYNAIIEGHYELADLMCGRTLLASLRANYNKEMFMGFRSLLLEEWLKP